MRRKCALVPANRLLRGAGLLAMAGLLLACPATAQASAVTVEQAQAQPQDPGPAGPPDRVNLLVHFEQGADRGPVRAFAQQQGGNVRHEYKVTLPNVINLRNIPIAAVAALERIPGVVQVEQDQYHPNLVKLHDSTPLIRGLQSQITGAGYSADGSGVRVCVCDTGIDTDHLMYADRIDTAAGYDFYNDDSNPEDDNGHGSHVSGIAVGGTGLSWDPCGTGSMPFQGVAPGATLIGAKILNQYGGGYDSDIIAGIDYCADQSPSGGRADVINLSIGIGQYSGPCTHSWAVAANNAVANGVVVVAASGNENYSNAMSSPACGEDVIAVGMTWKNDYPTCEDPTTNWNWGVCVDIAPQTDEIGCFSNESDYLDVAAPGANIWSASNAAGGGSIIGKSGTSMSSPQVAGLAALILDADPSLTPAQVRQVIRDGAIDMGTPGFDRAYGWGRIDVINSLALVSGPECSVPGDCDDSQWCNGAENCVSGSCVAGTPPDCNDGVACTDDSCNEGTDSCDNVPNDGHCDDGEPCTDDFCDAALVCQYVPDDSNSCDDGLWCNGAETCVGGTCQPGSDPCPGQSCDEVSDVCVPLDCDNDGTCESGEDCNNCPNDCISGGGTPGCGNGVCEPGIGEDCLSCPADCNGKQIGATKRQFCCGDGAGTNPVDCSDSRCSEETFACGDSPPPYCCGDGTCEGAEDEINCAVDCGCTTPADCDDFDECTVDDCVAGVCQNTPVADDTPCAGGLCCGGACTAPACSGDAECNDAEACTTDSCVNADTCSAFCDNTWPACGPADGCCGPGCDASDPDCDTCLVKGEPCTLDSECCSNWCHRGACK